MCLGGHLAYRCALDPRIASAVCYFATDIHSATLGEGKNDDSLKRTGEIKGELVMVRIRIMICFRISTVVYSLSSTLPSPPTTSLYSSYCLLQLTAFVDDVHRSSAKKTPTSPPPAAT
jgi:hypothetical protein